jgi:NAD+ synthase (glutamine-hydrolysing)
MKIALAQLNPTIGDFQGNLAQIEAVIKNTAAAAPDLIVFSELFLTGYPPRDFLDRRDFIDAAERALAQCVELSANHPAPALLVGALRPARRSTGNGLSNSAVLIRGGRILFEQAKTLLPSYDVFDETRYFEPAQDIDVFPLGGERLGITLCEDAWSDDSLLPKRSYPVDPVRILVDKGATVLINLSASPFFIGKEALRFRLVRSHVRRHEKPFFLVNQVGGNDELIFDGDSFALDSKGGTIVRFPSFREHVEVVETAASASGSPFHAAETVESIHRALIAGLSDYIRKCGFRKAVLGLSGGIDSSLVCCLAAEALGPENVLGIAMPSGVSSPESLEDAERLAKNLGIEFKIVPIARLVDAFTGSLACHFAGTPEGLAEENIQARIRGNLLMAFSNKFGHLTLSTGNKSELSVGYCTLYGDMSGGLSVIADLPKTWVYRVALEVNRRSAVIPERCFTKPPSAELRPNQKDQDTLPPYEVLDGILELYLEQELTGDEIVERNFSRETVEWVIRAVNKSEYKRRQAAPGLKLFPKAFGMGRRMPIAAKYPN